MVGQGKDLTTVAIAATVGDFSRGGGKGRTGSYFAATLTWHLEHWQLLTPPLRYATGALKVFGDSDRPSKTGSAF